MNIRELSPVKNVIKWLDVEQWKIRAVEISLLGILVSFTGSILIPAIGSPVLRFAATTIFVATFLFAVLFVAAYLFRQSSRIESEALAINAAEKASKNVIEAVMTYRFDEKKGGFYYGDVRNVVARIDTVQLIVLGLLEKKTSEIADKLREVGRQAGYSFAEDFEKEVLPHQHFRPNGLSKELLDLWRKYDYRAGFANFDFGALDIETGTGSVTIDGHFLNHGRLREEIILCPFFEGYIGAVLSHFLEREVVASGNCLTGYHRKCKIKLRRSEPQEPGL